MPAPRDKKYARLQQWVRHLPVDREWTAYRRQLWLQKLTELVDNYLTVIPENGVITDRLPVTIHAPPHGAPYIDLALTELKRRGKPMDVEDLLPLLAVYRGSATMNNLRTAIAKELRQPDPRLVWVDLDILGIAGRDAMVPLKESRVNAWLVQREKHQQFLETLKASQPASNIGAPKNEDEQYEPEIMRSVQGLRACLKCDREFLSEDRIKIRLCDACRRQED